VRGSIAPPPVEQAKRSWRFGGDFACIVDPVQRGELGFEILYASDREGLTHHRPQTLLLMIEAMFADVHMSVLHNGKTI